MSVIQAHHHQPIPITEIALRLVGALAFTILGILAFFTCIAMMFFQAELHIGKLIILAVIMAFSAMTTALLWQSYKIGYIIERANIISAKTVMIEDIQRRWSGIDDSHRYIARITLDGIPTKAQLIGARQDCLPRVGSRIVIVDKTTNSGKRYEWYLLQV